MKTAMRWVRDEIGRQELLVFGGIALVAVGVARFSVPFASIVAGALLMNIGLFGHLLARKEG